MGSVFKAHDKEVDRIVALKVIRPELAGSADILQRFRQELVPATTTAQFPVSRQCTRHRTGSRQRIPNLPPVDEPAVARSHAAKRRPSENAGR